MKLLLTRDQQSVLWHITETMVTPNGDRYYYCPFYMKECGDGMYERISFDNLPETAKEQILSIKGIRTIVNGKSAVEDWVESIPGSTRVSDYLYKINYNEVECAVLITRTTLYDYADIRPMSPAFDIGQGAGVSIRKEFKRN